MTKRVYRVLSFLLFFSSLLPTSGQDYRPAPGTSSHVSKNVLELPSHSPSTSLNTNRTAALGVTGTVTDALCYGSADGKIDYGISGGAAPYSYQWSNGVSGKVYGGCSNIITLTNPGAVTLNNYQVMVTLPYFTGMNADFSDVLFSDTLNNVSYSFWRESYTTNIEAVFWVKVPVLPAGTSYLRASYCDASAATQSNGPATFEYFDGFEDQDISDWNHVCLEVNFPDETCNANTIANGTNNYVTQLSSHAHCVGSTTPGVYNRLNKNVTLPAGQYWLDVSKRFRVCLHTNCMADSARIISYLYINSAFASAFYLERKGACGCINSGWVQIRANSATVSTGAPINYDLRAELTDCGEGEILYDNFRLRKYTVTPTVTIGPSVTLSLINLSSGNYTVTVTDGNGTITNQSFTVGQPAAPTLTNATVCANKPVALSALGAYPSYHWYAQPSGGAILFTGSTYNLSNVSKDSTLYVSGIGTNGCETSPRTAVTATVALPSGSNGCLTIFTGISPNGDGLNEAWEIKGIEDYPKNTVSLYDRWGNLVFKTSSYNNSSEKIWGGISNYGSSNGADLPEGTYFYDIDIEGLEKPLSGFVVLNRKH